MATRPDFERVRRTVRHEEPDRVPLCEALIEYPIQSRFLGRPVTADDLPSQLEFWVKAGYDYMPLTAGMMAFGKVTDESPISKILREQVAKDAPDGVDEKAWNLEYTSFIHNRAAFERFPWDAAAQIDLSAFHTVREMLPPGMKVIAMSGKVFTLAWMLMGFNNFGMSLISEPQLVADVFRQIGEIQIRTLDQILEMPHVGAVWIVDDIAHRNGPMISPRALREYVFPWYREMVVRCHAKDVLIFMHSDGNLLPLLEDLIGLGLDALHPIDPTCLDIVQVKRIVGDRICLIGNVSTELLQTGEPVEVEAVVKNLIREIAPGGGYCVSSGNSVPEWAKFENFMAMRETVLKYGSYPIRL